MTGDDMSLGDRASWMVQGFLRRWFVVLAHIPFSIVWWFRPELFGDDHNLTKWMALYSLLAVLQEGVVGIGMFGQAKRDAVILREIKKLVEKQERELEALEEHLG